MPLRPLNWLSVVLSLSAPCAVASGFVLLLRAYARRRRRYVRVRATPYRGDEPSPVAVVATLEALHRGLQRRWWRRLLGGQPSIALEVHCDREAWLGLCFPAGMEAQVLSALRIANPGCTLGPPPRRPGRPPCVLRLKKHAPFTKRVKALPPLGRYERGAPASVDHLITAMAACDEPAFVQLALTPTPALFESHAKRSYRRHEDRLSRARKLRLPPADPSIVERVELVGGLDVQHRPLYFADIRVVSPSRRTCERIASELRARSAENRLVERGTGVRHGWLGLYERRVLRGEGNPLPSPRKGVLSSLELAGIWQMPSLDYVTVPVERSSVPVGPAPPAVARAARASGARGTLCDQHGRVSIDPALRCQNTAVIGAAGQGKSSYLVASVAEDLDRERCAVIVLDPKGDVAEAALSVVPERRSCTLIDLARPSCGFDPLALDAPADAVADCVTAALNGPPDAGEAKASSDRYLRHAILAVLADGQGGSLGDVARLLSVGEEGYAYRARVAARLRARPEHDRTSELFVGELKAQLADARATTTARLAAAVGELLRLLGSPTVTRVLIDGSPGVDLDRVIDRREVLVVKGAPVLMGTDNTSALMRLLVGMLGIALARRRDDDEVRERTIVALKVDEAPLVLGRGFVEAIALECSTDLETVACWQTSAQWADRDLRAQLEAAFAHRVYFATRSVEDARRAAGLLMASFSDTIRPGIGGLSALARPDALLHLPSHRAIASWVTAEGRQAPFVARTLPPAVDRDRVAHHVRRQAERVALAAVPGS